MCRVLNHKIFGLLFFFALLFIAIPPVTATTVIMPTDDNMVIGSRAIVRGRVLNVESALDSQSNRIYTYITLRVQEVFKGKIKDRRIVLKQEGGQIEGRGSIVFGTPQFTPDEEVLLYLESWADGSFRVHQYFLGKFDIVTDTANGQRLAVRSEMSDGVVVMQNYSRLAEGDGITNRLELSAYVAMLKDKIAANAEQSQSFEQTYYSNVPMNARPQEYTDLARRGNLQPQWTYIHSAHPRWFEPDSGQPVVFHVNQAGAPNQQINNDIAAAMNVWSIVPGCSLRVAVGSNTDACFPDSTNNTIIFNNCDGRWSGSAGSCQGVLALGGLNWNGNSKIINGVTFSQASGGFISFNPFAACSFGNSCNVQEITTHELGHALGLGHSADTSATMYGIAHFDGRCASVRPDDATGIAFIYPGQGGGGGPLAITTASPLPNANVGSAFSQTIIGTGGSTPYTWSIVSGALPTGLSLNAQTGVISGTPTTATTANFTVQVRDNTQATAQKPFTLTVANASSPLDSQFVSWTVPTSVQPGQVFQINVKYNNTGTQGWVSSFTTDYYLASQNPALNTIWGGNGVSIANFPTQAGQQLDLTFTVTAPSTSGNYNFQWQMYQNGGIGFFGQLTPNVVIQVGSGGPTPLAITTTSLAGGTVGTAYSQTLAATGGTTPYSWSLISGTLPAGLTLNAATGAISGTPSASGTATFTMQVRDSAQTTATRQLSIQVNPATPPPLAITTTSLAGGTVGTAYSQTLAATGGTSPYTWSLAAGTLPAGLTLNANGTLSGTPTTAASSTFTMQVRDNAQITAQRQFTVQINAGTPSLNDATFVSQTVLSTMTAGQTYSVTVVMRNSGTTTWTTATYKLGSQNPQDNTTWGLNRVSPLSSTIPGANATFTFTITAPATAGNYNFQWKMFDGSAFFGAASTNVAVSVTSSSSCPSGGTDNSQFMSQDLRVGANNSAGQIVTNNHVTAGGRYTLNLSFKNTGTSYWNVQNGYELGAQSPLSNTFWGKDKVEIGNCIAPDTEPNPRFAINIIAPPVSGKPYNLQWQVYKNGSPIGVASASVMLTVDADSNDRDNDGIPNNLEAGVGKNPDLKDNNVLENNTMFVNQAYRDLLYRERNSQTDGNYWIDQLNNGSMTRAEIVARFFEAAEFYQNKAVIVKLYQECFNRLPDYEGIRYWLDQAAGGMTAEQIAAAFINSDEFSRRWGTLSNEAFVQRLFANALGRAATDAELAARLTQLSSGTSRGAVAVALTNPSNALYREFDLRVTIQVQIVEMYMVMLLRIPTSVEYNYWANTVWAGVDAGIEDQKRQKRIEMANIIMNGAHSSVTSPYSYRERFYLN
ncbi:MAG: DUF4214 domain-containing protein [Acidobacteria bacterium]|nr:DUF4214 domain-containing protein [Acidobacteriota bacterium]